MNQQNLTSESVAELVQAELVSMPPELREVVRPFLITPLMEMRNWDYAIRDGQDEILPCWIVANLLDFDIGFAYSSRGHGAGGYPWGLVALNFNFFGMNGSWYRSLEKAVIDSGFSEEMRECIK